MHPAYYETWASPQRFIITGLLCIMTLNVSFSLVDEWGWAAVEGKELWESGFAPGFFLIRFHFFHDDDDVFIVGDIRGRVQKADYISKMIQ